MSIKTPVHRLDDRLLIETFQFAELAADVQLLLLDHLAVALVGLSGDLEKAARGTKTYGLLMRRIDATKEAQVLERTRLAVFVKLKAETARELDRRGYPRSEYEKRTSI